MLVGEGEPEEAGGAGRPVYRHRHGPGVDRTGGVVR